VISDEDGLLGWLNHQRNIIVAWCSLNPTWLAGTPHKSINGGFNDEIIFGGFSSAMFDY